MNRLKTMGRWPTKGELIEYYSRDDICAVIYYQSKRWKILMESGGEQHFLEPTSEKDTRDQILRQLYHAARNFNETDQCWKFPTTLHRLKDRGAGATVRYDFITEDDPKSWRKAFAHMAKVLDVLDAHDVFYQLKFSGHRSLHLIIPAESFPPIFRRKPVNEQFDAIEGAIRGFLPPAGHPNPGLRVPYSLHPESGMASIPLRRREIPNFRPWMANLHTISVDWDWFDVPDDAVERNERFLHFVFDNRTGNVTVSVPSFEPLEVKVYTGETQKSAAKIHAGLRSEHWHQRVAAARATLVQNIQLPHEKLKLLLRDTHNDGIWFGLEIAMRDDRSAAIEEIKGLSDWRGDDYITSSLDHLFSVLTPEEIRDAALPSLTDSIETSPNPQAVVRCIDLLGRLVRHAVEGKALRAVDAGGVVGTLSGALTHELEEEEVAYLNATVKERYKQMEDARTRLMELLQHKIRWSTRNEPIELRRAVIDEASTCDGLGI